MIVPAFLYRKHYKHVKQNVLWPYLWQVYVQMISFYPLSDSYEVDNITSV